MTLHTVCGIVLVILFAILAAGALRSLDDRPRDHRNWWER